MPNYNYRCEETGEIKDFFFSMSEMKSSFTDEEGKTWKRDLASESADKSVHIPDHMKAGYRKGIMQGNRQRPSGSKRFY